MTATVCNASNVIEYSDLCVGDDPPEDCYPSVKDKAGLVSVALVFHALNIVLGIGGNLLTLLAIPYARHRRRFGFQGSNLSHCSRELRINSFSSFLAKGSRKESMLDS